MSTYYKQKQHSSSIFTLSAANSTHIHTSALCLGDDDRKMVSEDCVF